MLKRVFLLIIFAAVISAASAFGSPIVKEKIYADEVAAVELASDKTGIKDELDDKSLKQILADVLTIKGGKIGEIISKFLSNTSHWVWIVVEDVLPENVNGLTQLTSDGAQNYFKNYEPIPKRGDKGRSLKNVSLGTYKEV